MRGWRDVVGMTNGGYWADMDQTDVFVDPQYIGAGRPGPSGYIDLGVFNKSGPFDPDGKDLKRSFNRMALSNTTNPRNMATWIVNNPTYIKFLPLLHGQMHGQFHTFVGNQMSLTTTAALDPLFWMHHCLVDLLYHLWGDCHGHEGITQNTIQIPTHYVEQNPIGNTLGVPNANSKYYPDGTYIDVGLWTPMDLWLTATAASFLDPMDFPTPAEMFTMGPGGWGGINYRYGPFPDQFIMSQKLDTRCPNKEWNWVNQPSY
jgi:hypothetical protein